MKKFLFLDISSSDFPSISIHIGVLSNLPGRVKQKKTKQHKPLGKGSSGTRINNEIRGSLSRKRITVSLQYEFSTPK
jgi:hypothetical protein